VDTARLQRKRTTEEHLEKGSGEGFMYSWRKMEVGAQDTVGWSGVVCGL